MPNLLSCTNDILKSIWYLYRITSVQCTFVFTVLGEWITSFITKAWSKPSTGSLWPKARTRSATLRISFKFKFKFKKFLFKKYKKIYKYRMETETLEGLYVPSSIFNSHYTIISSFVTTQVSRWVWEKKKYKIKTSSKSGCAIGNTSMNSVVHISKIMSVQSYSRFHHFECV